MGPLVFVALGIVLFAAYLAQARTLPATSESGGQALQAWDMLHGNPLLRGWTLSDVSFYTTELPEYMLVELVRGLNADVVHVAAALSYTLLVLLGGLLAKGRATGREGLVRVLIAAGIMLAPPLSGTGLLLGSPDHVGTHVPLLIIFLVLDRAPARRWTPVVVAILLTWAQVGDPLVLFEGAFPLAAACALRAYRRRGPLAGQWYDLSLAGAALVSAVAARIIITLIRHVGGFVAKTPAVSFTSASALHTGVWTDLSRVLDVYGAKFFGLAVGPGAFGALVHLVGVGLVAWAGVAGVRRLYGDGELIVQVLTIALVFMLAGFVLGTKNDANEIVGVLPIGAVLAGRLLARPVTRRGLIPVLAIALACYAGILVYNAARPPLIARGDQLTASWLAAHHLDYGLAGFWNATSVTVESGDRIQVRPVRSFHDRIVITLSESDASWYDPHQHDARFVISSRWWTAPGLYMSMRPLLKTFGPPARTYRVGGHYVLVWNKNLLTGLRTLSWCNKGWPWNTTARPSHAPCT